MLSQAEIDALLGAVPAEAPASEPAGGVTTLPATGRSVKTYDFRRPDKFSKDQLRTLQAVHENVARVAAARLSARLRSAVAIHLAGADQMVFDDYLDQLALPTQLIVYDATGLQGPFMVDLDMSFAAAAIDRMLGGAGQIPAERREPTTIEAELIGRLINDITPAFNEGWGHLQTLNASLRETAYGPALLRVAAPTHVVAVLTYEVRFFGQTAPLTVCYPYASLEALMPRLSATAWYAQPDRTATTGRSRAEVEDALQLVEIPLIARLGSVDLPLEALADLEPGDVIRFDDRADQPLRLSIMNQANAWAVPGRVGDRLALRVVTPLQPVEA